MLEVPSHCSFRTDFVCVMIKRKDMNQIGNLTVDHKSLKNKGQMNSDWGHVIHR